MSASPRPRATPGLARHASRPYHTPSTGVFALLPQFLVPWAELMHLNQPEGYLAFYWHYAIGLAFAACIAAPHPPPLSAFITIAGYLSVWVFIFRGAVCTWNDILDEVFDWKATRTQLRPLSRGALSMAQAQIFLLLQVILLGILLIPLSTACLIYADIMAMVFAINPLVKRMTHFSPFVLGAGFAVPILMSCAAFRADPLLQALLGMDLDEDENEGSRASSAYLVGAACLYLASLLTTVIFESIFAHQNIKDDLKTGVRSLALYLGPRAKQWLSFLASIQVCLTLAVGFSCGFSLLYYTISCGGLAISLASLLYFVDLTSPASCALVFRQGSIAVGLTLTIGLLAEYMYRSLLSIAGE
ncbi:hypothetical protein ASPZODRAFT_73709 [Penicilliopsis zonata CBS 506.65]|uniref:4-hydroxybenzoate polyprenyl transferase n=1 Tax=Penicilliopsis zonata CBS 506.65 TaxID=1073090 RepID=A0A1L9S9S4_9EURO|nr:hypothetical protein ASPZODRAFT_73709 [Penicilliopsis zonata CBS 506.65]OJJ43898.1 hypothetical protein ASPZODRAFT_73709 [Penicilliopsis zonata CBS 506.65]